MTDPDDRVVIAMAVGFIGFLMLCYWVYSMRACLCPGEYDGVSIAGTYNCCSMLYPPNILLVGLGCLALAAYVMSKE